MIHVQRPDAIACAEYRLWSEKMNRHVRYGAKGIAIISEANGTPVLRYVFDVSDTRPRANARTPYLWQYREEHQGTVMKMLEDCFQVPADKGVSFQLATVAAQFSEKYWKSYQKEILCAVKNTLLKKYGEADVGMAFQDATAASVSYALLYRCGLSPEQFFEAEDFSHVYEFSDYESVLALGTAVNQVGMTLLMVLGHTIKEYEREKRARQQQQRINDPPLEPAADPGDHAAPEPEQRNTATQEGPDEASSGPSSVPAPEQQEIALPGPVPAPAPANPKPEPKPEPAPENFRITDDHLGEGGPKSKYAMNVAAINVLRRVEAEGRWATPEEQEVLSRYVGWGGIPEAFDESKPEWTAEYQELRSLLTDDEYASARASTLNAHYTSPVVVKAIYQAIAGMGFRSGNILEPSCGVGNFFGLLPEAMSASKLYGVELDGITGRIARQLYPKADIQVTGFESTGRREFYDLAVGNVPFGQYKVNDPAYNKLGFSIHNYFFAKALDQLRPGGILAFVTSRYTMDAEDATARKYLAGRAVLLGAVRLPNNAFRANAGTDVVSDVIFLQKSDMPILEEPEWVRTAPNELGFSVNQYFLSHPDMVLGVSTEESTQYGRQDYTVAPVPGADLARQLQTAIQNIHGKPTRKNRV